jgi:outer membrane protein assembly factor BamB
MNTDESVSSKVSKIIAPEFGTTAPLSEADLKFSSSYTEELERLAQDLTPLTFKNVIRNEGQCGFASGGQYHMLLNTDSTARYRVTVRTAWQQGISSGSSDSIQIIEAGSKVRLGCSDSGSIPVAYYTRTVVGEVRI